MKKPDSILFFANGNSVVFTKDGNQIPELGGSWFSMKIQKMIDDGVDLSECTFVMPDGKEVEVILNIEDDGWNWRAIH